MCKHGSITKKEGRFADAGEPPTFVWTPSEFNDKPFVPGATYGSFLTVIPGRPPSGLRVGYWCRMCGQQVTQDRKPVNGPVV